MHTKTPLITEGPLIDKAAAALAALPQGYDPRLCRAFCLLLANTVSRPDEALSGVVNTPLNAPGNQSEKLYLDKHGDTTTLNIRTSSRWPTTWSVTASQWQPSISPPSEVDGGELAYHFLVASAFFTAITTE